MDNEFVNKRTAILTATLDLISEQGFQGTPMSQIAKRANAGVGTIYRYFSGKDELINALYLEVKMKMADIIMQNYSEDLAVSKAFKLIIRDMVEFYIKNPQVLSFSEQYLNSPLITAATHAEGSRIFEPVSRLFFRALEQDMLKPIPMLMMGELIIGAVVSLSKYYINNQNQKEAEMNTGIDAIWDMIRS